MLAKLNEFFRHFSAERLGWFGAGLSAAAVGVVGYQLFFGAMLAGPLPGLQATLLPTLAASPTPTRTVRPTATSPPSPTPRRTPTPWPTATPRPSATPSPVAPDLLGTITVAEPEVIVGAVATFAARTRHALESLPITPRPR